MNAQHLLDEATKTQNIQAAAAALLLLNVTEPELKEEQYCDRAALILDQFTPCDSDDRHLSPEEEDLCDEMFEAAMELAAKLTKEFAKNLTN